MNQFNPIDIIYLVLILLTVYFTGKLAVKKVLNNIRDLVRAAVIDGLRITTKDNNKIIKKE